LIYNAETRYGGGAFSGTLWRCAVVSNYAGTYGGGTYYGVNGNCLIATNYAPTYGGGTYRGWNQSCTIVTNRSGTGGGTYGGSNLNCIVYVNRATTGPNYSGGTHQYSCAYPKPTGTGNISNNPAFTGAGSYQLQATSPCVDKGTNVAWMTGALDLAGNNRIYNTRVDLGAYEYSGAGGGKMAQAGSTGADTAPVGTVSETSSSGTTGDVSPAEVAPSLHIGIPDPEGTVPLWWLSLSNRYYMLSKATNRPEGFWPLSNNIPATPPTNFYGDGSGAAPAVFYRLDVKP
jgi:hypothetical protein